MVERGVAVFGPRLGPRVARAGWLGAAGGVFARERAVLALGVRLTLWVRCPRALSDAVVSGIGTALPINGAGLGGGITLERAVPAALSTRVGRAVSVARFRFLDSR